MDQYGYGYWDLVLWNVILFGFFLLFIPFKRRIERLPGSIYLSFITALYAEMYGAPLTIYILAWLFGYQNPLTHMSGHILAGILGEALFFSIFHPLSNMMILIGLFLVVIGWRKIYGAKNELVTTGIYGYVRHPQYLGLLLLTLGMIVQWVTIPTLLMWPILAVLYYRLAKEEEKEMEEMFGKGFQEYKRRVPMFIPFSKS